MVRFLRLSKFRSYRNGELEFCPGVNGIIGISGSGKTNIIRAFRWLSTLKPTTKNIVFRRQPKVDAKVEAEFFNGNTVSLEKGNKTSGIFTFGDTTYRKFGRQVPEEISSVLNLSDINFHEQFDPPFLAMSKPSEVSRVIGEMTGMNDFDEWINKTNEEIRKLKAEENILGNTQEKHLIELEMMDTLEDCEPYLKRAHKYKQERLKLLEKFEKAEDLFKRIQQLEEKIEKHKNIAKIKPHIQKLEDIRKKMDEKEDVILLLEKVRDKEHEIDMANEERQDMIEEYAKLLSKAGTCPTCHSPIRQKTVKRLIDEISSHVRYSCNGQDSGWKAG